MSAFAGCGKSSPSMVVRIISPPEKDVFDHKWSFVSRSPLAPEITLQQDDPLDYKISDLIYLTPDFLVEGLDHPFLVRLTMANSSESFLVDQIELIKSGLNPIVFTQTSILHDSQGENLNLHR